MKKEWKQLYVYTSNDKPLAVHFCVNHRSPLWVTDSIMRKYNDNHGLEISSTVMINNSGRELNLKQFKEKYLLILVAKPLN